MSNHSKAVATAKPERKEKRIGRQAVESPDKALARRMQARLDKDELVRKMTVGLYVLKSKDSPFGLPYCAVNDNFALLAQKQVSPLTDCYKVGTYCMYDGKVTSVKPVIILDRGVSNE